MSERMLLIVDGQGGGMGAQLVKRLLPSMPAGCSLVAVGTNALATSAMIKAGAPQGATGDNAVIYNAARASWIAGPIGIIVANGILGEVSPAMATAISGAAAKKILLPSSGCGVAVAGVQSKRLDELMSDAVTMLLHEMSAEQ